MARLGLIILVLAVIIVALKVHDDHPQVAKEPPGHTMAGRTVASYRGRASFVVFGTRQHVPVTIDITSWSRGAFTGSITIQAARIVTVPLTGKYTPDNISGSGSVPDGSLSISIQATRGSTSIMGTYQATVANYRQYNLDSRVVSGDVSVSLVTAHNVPPMTYNSQVCTLSFTADTGAGSAVFYNIGRGSAQKIRAEIAVRSANAVDTEFTIVRSGTTYRWKNDEKRGCKFPNAPVSFIEYLGLEDYQLDCQKWSPDEAKFAVPKSIHFTFLERPDIEPCVGRR